MKNIPMLDLKIEYDYMKKDIDAAIRTCLEHQKWILGPEVKELEDKIAGYAGVKHCIGISSGTESLVLSLRALAIKLKGKEYFDRTDEIITSPFTFTATGDAILRSGATPVFVDVDPATYNIDPENVRKYLAQNSARVVGLMPVHLYGRPCRMDEIMDMAGEFGLFVVEDAAQAFGGMWKDKKLGSIGNTGSFSFFPSKNLGGFGDGGMVSTDDDETAGLVRMLLKHGGRDKYNVDHIGYNARLDTIHAAVLLAKFKYIDEFLGGRRRIAGIYNRELAEVDGLILPVSFSESAEGHEYHVFNQYTIRVTDGRRNALQKHLSDHGVGAMVYYPTPLHKMRVFHDGRSKSSGALEHSEQAPFEVLSLPIEPLMKETDVMSVVEAIKSFKNSS